MPSAPACEPPTTETTEFNLDSFVPNDYEEEESRM